MHGRKNITFWVICVLQGWNLMYCKIRPKRLPMPRNRECWRAERRGLRCNDSHALRTFSSCSTINNVLYTATVFRLTHLNQNRIAWTNRTMPRNINLLPGASELWTLFLNKIEQFCLLLLLLLLSSSSSLSPLCRVSIHIFLRQTMSLGNTLLQLFCLCCLWCLYF